MKKLIIHVGLHKTATSSIQSTLAHNRQLLEAQGITYPIFNLQDKLIDNHSIPFYSLFCEEPEKYHINIRFNVDIQEQHKAYRAKIDEMLRNKRCVFISGEDISLLSLDALLTLTKLFQENGFEIEAHCVVRPPYSLLCSLIQQNIKGGLPSLDSLHPVIISETIGKLRKAFKNIKFHSFTALCAEKSAPVLTFLGKLDIDTTNFEVINTNEGLGNLTTRLLNHVNKKVPSIQNGLLNPKRENIHHFDSTYNCDSEKFFLTNSELTRVKETLDNENMIIAQELGVEFTDRNYPVASEDLPSPSFIEQIIDRFKDSPQAMKRAVYDYILEECEYSDENNLDSFFNNRCAQLNADILRNTAILWENTNIHNALTFMELAKKYRPNGEFILQKIEEYHKKLKQEK